VSVERLDEAKLETLRRWGIGLGDDPREELRAAGRAILLLIEEVEHLHVDLWHARETAVEPADDALPADSLLTRIRRLRFRADRDRGLP
jgi:hypothetical protein